MDTVLDVKNLVKRYGDNIVIKNVSFSLERGKIYGLLGPNGAGKTTIMKLICNLIKKDGGTISYRDETKIKYLMDVPNFYEYMTINEYLLFIASLNNLENKQERVDALIKETNLTEHQFKKIKQLSRGLRQKLGIASVLVGDLDILILDEPVSALDPIGRKEVLDLIASLKDKMTIIFSSNILLDIEKVCDHILLINNGKIISDGECKEILSSGNYLLVKCTSNEDARNLKDNFDSAKFSSTYENTLEIEYQDLIDTQLTILKIAKKLNIVIEKLEVKKSTLEEVFLTEVNKHE
jgi:ABC-2 type transport system ATP-binding protein